MAHPSDTDPFARLQRFFRELRRRKVYRVAVVYVIGAVAGLELLDALVPSSRLPPWSDELFLGLAVFGFPLAVILAWAFEITPEGVRRTESSEDEPAERSAYPVIGGIVVTVVAIGIWWFATMEDPGSVTQQPVIGESAVPAHQRPFVAVLPLENLSPDEENAYFAAGIHEEILTQLSKVSGLGVFAGTTMNQYKDTDLSIFEIGRELGAAAVLEGSVRRADDRVRISAQLIDPQSRDHLWSETYDGRLDDVFALQEDIARRVVQSLEATISREEEEQISKRPTRSLAAYHLYLKGREAYRRFDAEGNAEAIRLFEAALELDPDYALAFAGLGDTYAQRNGRFGYPHGPSADSAVRQALRAVQIDPELAEGQEALGYAYQAQGNLDDALDAYLKAVTYDPNNYEAWRNAGEIYYSFGRFDETVRVATRAARLAPNELRPRFILAHAYKFLMLDEVSKEWMESILVLDPRHAGARLLGAQFAVYRGDTEEALEQAVQVTQDAPDYAFAWTGAAGIAYMSRDFARAVEWAGESLRVSPGNTWAYLHHTETLLGISLLQWGDLERAGEVLDRATESYRQRMASGERYWALPWDMAAVHGARGDGETALEWLERAYDEDFRFVRWPPIDPAFDELRDDPRYQRLIDRMEAAVSELRSRLDQNGQM